MNRTATPPPYPQGCGRILWIPRRCTQYRGPAGSAAAPTETPSAFIGPGLTAPPRMSLLPNKYTSWGKLCGLRPEIGADLGIDCGPYVVVLSCWAPFAALYPGTGETVSRRDLRIRQLSPASTQPTTTYLYVFALQDRQAIGTGVVGDNLPRRPRALVRGHHAAELGRDLPTVSDRGRGRKRQTISCADGKAERFPTGGVVTLVRRLAPWPTKRTISSRSNPFDRLGRPDPAIARRTGSQPGERNPVLYAGSQQQLRLRNRSEVRLTPARTTSRPRRPIEGWRRDLSDRRGRQDWCGRRGRPDERLERQTRHPVMRPWEMAL